MPQLSQLPDVVLSQLFWLLLVLGFIYVVIGRGMVPKIQSTVDRRDQQIKNDLAAAEAAKAEADRTEEAFRARMDESRAAAARLSAKAKADSAVKTEAKLAEVEASLDARFDEAQARIRAARRAATSEIEAMTAQLTQDIVAKVAGLTIKAEDAAKAVKVALSNG